MYIAIMKLTFDPGTSAGQDRKALYGLMDKLRAKFKGAFTPLTVVERDGVTGLAVAIFGKTEQDLTRELDAIVEVCEGSGIGRIESEHAFIEHLDAIGADMDEDE